MKKYVCVYFDKQNNRCPTRTNFRTIIVKYLLKDYKAVTNKTDIINVIYLFAVKRIDKFQSIYRYNRFPQHSKRYRQHISVSHHCSNNSDQSLAYQVSCSGTEAPINAAN